MLTKLLPFIIQVFRSYQGDTYPLLNMLTVNIIQSGYFLVLWSATTRCSSASSSQLSKGVQLQGYYVGGRLNAQRMFKSHTAICPSSPKNPKELIHKEKKYPVLLAGSWPIAPRVTYRNWCLRPKGPYSSAWIQISKPPTGRLMAQTFEVLANILSQIQRKIYGQLSYVREVELLGMGRLVGSAN